MLGCFILHRVPLDDDEERVKKDRDIRGWLRELDVLGL